MPVVIEYWAAGKMVSVGLFWNCLGFPKSQLMKEQESPGVSGYSAELLGVVDTAANPNLSF